MTEPEASIPRTSGVGLLTAGLALLALSGLDVLMVPCLAKLLTGETLSEPLIDYYRDGQIVLGLTLVLLGITALLVPTGLGRIVSIPWKLQSRNFQALICTTCLACALLIQSLLFDNIPHVTDAISHDFQARLMMLGKVVAPRPPCHEAFFQDHLIMTADGKWFSKYTPGHPVVLFLGYLFRAPALPVPLCHMFSALLIYRLTRRFFDDPTARSVTLLYSISPIAMLLSGSFMSHTSFLCMVLAGTWGLVNTYDSMTLGASSRKQLFWGFFAGFFWGWALITRPQDAAIGGLMVVLTCLAAFKGPWPRLLATGFKALPGLLPPLGLYLFWNQQQYGMLFTIGYGFTQGQAVNRIYQASFGLSENFTIRDAAQLLIHTLYRFDRAALGWPLTLPLCLPAFFRHQLDRRDVAVAIALAVHVVVYFFYNYYGLEFEARYYFNLLPLALVLIVRSCGTGDANSTSRVVAVALMAHTAFAFWPAIILPTYGHDYEQASRAVSRASESSGLSNALVLVESSGDQFFRYSSGMICNDPLLKNNVIYARQLDSSNIQCLKEHFPDRTIYTANSKDVWPGFTFHALTLE